MSSLSYSYYSYAAKFRFTWHMLQIPNSLISRTHRKVKIRTRIATITIPWTYHTYKSLSPYLQVPIGINLILHSPISKLSALVAIPLAPTIDSTNNSTCSTKDNKKLQLERNNHNPNQSQPSAPPAELMGYSLSRPKGHPFGQPQELEEIISDLGNDLASKDLIADPSPISECAIPTIRGWVEASKHSKKPPWNRQARCFLYNPNGWPNPLES